MLKFLDNLVNDSKKTIKKIRPLVDRINTLEDSISKLSDADLLAQTAMFKQQLANGATVDDIMAEAFATAREASIRTLGMRHFDVQLIGGVVLHQGRIAEMKTGEGKTLVATLPVYLNALTGKGVHVITVNDYLAKRDSEWMGQIYKFLGMDVGLIVHDIHPMARQTEYAKDIVYGTNNEFGFDYLRDNMAVSKEAMVQRELNYAIVDEVDSILIDEARTPLIISGEADKPTEMYETVAKIMPVLKKVTDFTTDEKQRIATLTDDGLVKVEKMLGVKGVYEDNNAELGHHINQALVAQAVMKKDVDYIVKEGEIVIVDSFTGRLMYGRRYSNGLHQAIEAKERVRIQKESQTLATITFQNYFRMYNKISGMTGTAKTEENEFREIYGMDVVVIPTNVDVNRKDEDDKIYKTEFGKFNAIADEVAERYKTGQPVLVGTISIEKSEALSGLLKRRGIPHQVLNAKYHEKEAEIIAMAGQKGAVTIATNMAGRGTDIVLGEGVKETGGLCVFGSERHESRRIDNQLRGRSGRQGDPGISRFFISSEDDLLRVYGGERMQNLLKMGTDDDLPVDNPIISKGIERAQKAVENRHFEARKHVLEYDNIMNQQREIIYSQRKDVLFRDDLKTNVISMIEDVIDNSVYRFSEGKEKIAEWDLDGLLIYGGQTYLPHGGITKEDLLKISEEEIRRQFRDIAVAAYEKNEEQVGPEIMRFLEKQVVLRSVDKFWMAHIDNMDELRQGVNLRAYGQKNPLTEYKFESYDIFQVMVEDIKEEVARLIYRVKVVEPQERIRNIKENRSDEDGGQTAKNSDKIGRNDPCPCGSGKKYKQCCGR
ncbi:MAG: preprotein translocase subunit SecA [Fusobacteria bacterium]|nr:MAG: preprotein translocase subunit SecA [Fusobacteriota bacterium]KAF0228088.1 MAG: preprotein translocase subunit [Fusobacteriota bacterium]